VASELKHHWIVTVATADHRELQGSVSEARADNFVLTNRGRSTELSYAEVEKIAWPPHVSKHVVAVIVGVAVAVTLWAGAPAGRNARVIHANQIYTLEVIACPDENSATSEVNSYTKTTRNWRSWGLCLKIVVSFKVAIRSYVSSL
jgi:hypothetical protein